MSAKKKAAKPQKKKVSAPKKKAPAKKAPAPRKKAPKKKRPTRPVVTHGAHNIGKIGRDKQTGFEGLITGHASYLFEIGSYRISEIAKPGKAPAMDWFNEDRVELI